MPNVALTWLAACLSLLLVLPPVVAADSPPPQKAEMAGYLLVPHARVDANYNAGFSMYVAGRCRGRHEPS